MVARWRFVPSTLLGSLGDFGDAIDLLPVQLFPISFKLLLGCKYTTQPMAVISRDLWQMNRFAISTPGNTETPLENPR